jgi:hypothetical protein
MTKKSCFQISAIEEIEKVTHPSSHRDEQAAGDGWLANLCAAPHIAGKDVTCLAPCF